MNDKGQNAIWLAKRMLIDSIYRSAGVEGLGLTFPDTVCIIENAPVNVKPSDVLFVLNMRDAWRFLLENIDYKNDLMFIREINKICGDKLIYGCGVLRTSEVRISGCKYIPPIPDHGAVVSYLKNIDLIEDPVQKALVMFCYLAKSQLFIDGNKRVAQLMANKVLIENGIGILSIPQENKIDFVKSLVKYYDTNNAKDLCMFLSRYCIEKV